LIAFVCFCLLLFAFVCFCLLLFAFVCFCLLLFACFIFVPHTGTYYADRRVSTVVSTGAFLLEMSNPDYVFFMVCHGQLCVLYGLSYIRVTFVSRLL
jgi:hypothetical protein